jgi:heme/copper-type cytochrome/quinol oxidase subunit 2
MQGTVISGLTVGVVVMLSLVGGAVAQERQVVQIVAERFTFTPSRIEVPVGTTVEIHIRSEDTNHGFHLVGGENVIIPKRRQGEAVVVFEADEPGTYRFECSKLCGAGHNFMRGEIIVTAPDVADGDDAAAGDDAADEDDGTTGEDGTDGDDS